MEGYKSFRETVEDASKATGKWRYVGDNNIFDKQELLDMAEFFDEQFPLGEWNYFVCFPDGEIGLLDNSDNEIEQLFLPA